MKYYSDVTCKTYDTEEACIEAEKKMLKQQEEDKLKKEQETAERKAMATEVEKSRKAMIAAQKAYRDKLEAFCDRYGSYHYTTTNADEIPLLFDFPNPFFL